MIVAPPISDVMAASTSTGSSDFRKHYRGYGGFTELSSSHQKAISEQYGVVVRGVKSVESQISTSC